MTVFVLDSSVAIKWVLPETDSAKARSLQEDIRKNLHEIIAPDVFASEVAHVLTKAERKRIIPVGEAFRHLTDILRAGPVLYSFLPLPPRAVEISSKTRIAVTDCLFVALAERENCEFLTADQRLITNLLGYPIVSLDSV